MVRDSSGPRRQLAHALLSPLTIILGAAETLDGQAEGWTPEAREMLGLILEQARRLQETLAGMATTAQVEGNLIRMRWADLSPQAETTAARPERPEAGAVQEVEEASPSGQEAPSPPGRVLVVDDDAVTRTMLQALLQKRGFEVCLAGSGMEAIDLARAQRPDLILLDIVMPGVDGLQMFTVFREDPLLKEVPIVIVSSVVAEETLPSADFPWTVPKPISPEQLLSTVESALSAPPGDTRPSILIVDDEEGVRRELDHHLTRRGYYVREAACAADALTEVARGFPDAVLLDLYLPDMSGMEVLRRLREQESTLTLPVLLLSVVDDPNVKAQALRLGADDYISKPFSLLELQARLEAVLRRKQLEFSFSPSTRLPGNITIERILRQRVASAVPFAVCYADLDNFKAYNDVYGFLKGDGVIHQAARVLVEAVRELGNPGDFIGHVGGDDFVVVTTPERAEPICRRAVQEFDRVIPLYYDAEARARGYVEVLDRHGWPARFPLMAMALVIVSTDGHTIEHPGQLVDLIAEPKQRAKQMPGSSIVSVWAGWSPGNRHSS